MAHALAQQPSGPLLKSPRELDPKHLKFVRSLPCVITGMEGVEACHLRASCLPLKKRHTGRGEKPSDKYVLPMTPAMHRSQHSMNEEAFWRLQGFKWIDVVQLALDLHEHSGDEEACLAIIRKARR